MSELLILTNRSSSISTAVNWLDLQTRHIESGEVQHSELKRLLEKEQEQLQICMKCLEILKAVSSVLASEHLGFWFGAH